MLDLATNEVAELCKQCHVKTLHAFGSVITENFNENSDIDLVVDFSDINLEDYADNYYHLKFSLQNIFNRPIDLLENKAINNPFFKQEIMQKSQLIYGFAN